MSETRREYDFASLEAKWTEEWERTGEFRFEDDGREERKYILDMFPYPSGSGLHVGHLKGYLATDILTRLHTMQGYLVFHPMGWDAFGLPAEQYAIATGNSPATFTLENIDNFRKQLRRLMLSYDFSREVNTSDPNYFKHTQWIFSQLYKRGLAEVADVPVNWCEELNTVLSDEEILEDGDRRISERGGHPVTRKVMRQWILKITKYADRLLEDLDGLEWPDNIKQIQRNWIGREIRYRLDLVHGDCSYSLHFRHLSSIRNLVGVGIHGDSNLPSSLPPKLRCDLLNRDLEIWLLNGETPGTDDFIPLFKDGMDEEEFFDPDLEKEYLEKYGDLARVRVTYRLRDWVFSRQRFWGEPIPILHEVDGEKMILDTELPVILPTTVDYKSKRHGQSPLANDPNWMSVERGGVQYLRETNTMPNWAGSSWYFMAYLLRRPDGTYHDLDSPEAKAILERWLPVDIYVGGQEHATMHLLYARFWHKFLHDLGIVKCNEPFRTLFNQGLVMGSDGQKMSKSKGNYVSIEEMVDRYGADALRVYEAFSGPTQLCFSWDEKGIVGSHKWLSRVHNLFFNGLKGMEEVKADDVEVSKAEDRLIENVASAIPLMKVNVGVSEMMIFINSLVSLNRYHRKSLESFVKILGLYAPALAQEIWSECLGNKSSLFRSQWPQLNGLGRGEEEMRVFSNGKYCFSLQIKVDELENEGRIEEMAKAELESRGLVVEEINVAPKRRVVIARSRR